MGKRSQHPSRDSAQGDLFGGAPTQPQYRPNPQYVRNRLDSDLAEARAADKMPWNPTRLQLNRMAFRDITRHLPDDEAARYRQEFEAELVRLGVGPDFDDPESAPPF